MSVTNQPQIEAYIGASGSGKGVSINSRLKELAPRRLLIWDPRDEYRDHAKPVTTLAALLAAVRKAGTGGSLKVRFVPGAAVPMNEAFAIVCGAVFVGGDMTFVAEELSDVTTASHAPAAWRQVITQGRHRALHVLGAAQRPALIDKTFLGNCTYIRCFTLRYSDDRRAMAKALDVSEEQVTRLATTEEGGKVLIRFVERDFRAQVLREGQIALKK